MLLFLIVVKAHKCCKYEVWLGTHVYRVVPSYYFSWALQLKERKSGLDYSAR